MTLLPGAYYCNQTDLGGGTSPTLTFPAGFTVGGTTGQVALYLIPTDGSNIHVSIADTCGWQNPNGPCTTGINYNGDPTNSRSTWREERVDPGNGMTHSGNFTGIMWAPNADEQNPSCNATWRGAIVANSFTCNGGTHLDVKYDSRHAVPRGGAVDGQQLDGDPVDAGVAALTRARRYASTRAPGRTRVASYTESTRLTAARIESRWPGSASSNSNRRRAIRSAWVCEVHERMFTWCSESTSATSRSSFERSSASISTDTV